MTVIRVQKRQDDYMAYFDGRPGCWECAATADSAVGGLLRTWGKEFEILVVAEGEYDIRVLQNKNVPTSLLRNNMVTAWMDSEFCTHYCFNPLTEVGKVGADVHCYLLPRTKDMLYYSDGMLWLEE